MRDSAQARQNVGRCTPRHYEFSTDSRGAGLATRPFVLFCDDDACFEPGCGQRRLGRMKDTILTRNELLRKLQFDSFCREGNGNREESDFQMAMTVMGYAVVLRPEAHCIHLPMEQVANVLAGECSTCVARSGFI